MTLDIVIYEKFGEGEWAQAQFLAHGYDDVLWTNDYDEALGFLRAQIKKLLNS